MVPSSLKVVAWYRRFFTDPCVQFTNPMEVSWAAMDRQLLHKFWSQKMDLYSNAASISDRVLVLNRGVHLVRLNPLAINPFWSLTSSCTSLLRSSLP